MTDLQGRKNKKRVFKAGIAGVMLVSALYLPYNAFADPILNAPNTSVPGANDVASAEYEFVADFNKAETEVIPFGGEWTEMANLAGRSKDWYAIKPTDAQKGKIGVKYTNVGRYQGEEIDLVITINDFESFNANQGYIAYSKTSIGHITQQYNWVDQTWHFVKHGTNTPIQVSGYMTINDIDYLQQFTFSKETAAAVDQILVPVANSKVEYDANGGAWKFYAPSAYSSNDYDEDAMFTFLYSDASELRFRWGRDNRDLTVASKPNDEVVAGDYFGYLAKKPLRTETLVPVKQVSDSDETAAESNNLQNVSETFTYDIFHTVPDEWAEFYYASYRFTDTLADVLDVKSVKVFNEEGTDVTSWFTNDSNGNQIVLNAKPEVLQTASFYRNTYNYKIETAIKAGADLTDYVVQDGSIQIPNQATVKIGDESQNSNTVITKPPVIDASATKSILEDGELKQHQDLEKGEAIQYQMDFEVPNNKKLTSLVLYDDMEDVLDISTADAKVYLGNQDVTAKGTLKFDEEAEKIVWTATNPQEFSGKKLTLRASASVKEDADLSTYVDENGMVVIPNEAHMTVNDEDVPSNVVTVTPPPVEPSVNKHILADDEEVTHQDVTLTDLITYKLDYQVPTNEKITELILWDDMEDVLEIQTKDVSITCDGVDVTAEGELTINEETEKLEWKATNPAKFTGKKLTVQVSAKVKAGADLSSYMDGNGEIMIPNTAHMKVNDEELESPVVTVTPPTPADPLNPLTPLAPDVDKPLVPTNPTEESNPKTKTEQEAVNEIPKTGSAGTGYKLLDFFKGLF